MALDKPIGIFGGTFDPVHFGHLRTGLELQHILDLQEIRFIPCQYPVHKEEVHASDKDRLAMLTLGLGDTPNLRIDDREIQRPSPSYMVDTLTSLRKELPNTPLCLIIGSDAFLRIQTWDRWEKLLELAHIIVVMRPHYTLKGCDESLQALIDKHYLTDSEGLYNNLNGYIYLQSLTELDISATAIRSQLAAGYNVRYLTPEPVIDYIQQHQLYSAPN